jgi:hypothetical protein
VIIQVLFVCGVLMLSLAACSTSQKVGRVYGVGCDTLEVTLNMDTQDLDAP